MAGAETVTLTDIGAVTVIETPPFLRLTWQYTKSPVNLERDIGEHSTVTDAICLAFVITGFLVSTVVPIERLDGRLRFTAV